MEKTWPQMPWDAGNIISKNLIHEVDGILGDSGSLYTLGVQGNRPFRIGSSGRAYPAAPLPPLEILPMSQMTENYVHSNGWPGRPRFDGTTGTGTPGDGSHGPGGIYTDNGSTGWNVSANVLTNVTVWAVACYAEGIDNNSFIGNSYICQTKLPGRDPGWCGPIQKQGDCPTSGNRGVNSTSELSPASLAVIERAGPRKHAKSTGLR
jgi:hypothetical protein